VTKRVRGGMRIGENRRRLAIHGGDRRGLTLGGGMKTCVHGRGLGLHAIV
jgi:hypothetical protein